MPFLKTMHIVLCESLCRVRLHGCRGLHHNFERLQLLPVELDPGARCARWSGPAVHHLHLASQRVPACMATPPGAQHCQESQNTCWQMARKLLIEKAVKVRPHSAHDYRTIHHKFLMRYPSAMCEQFLNQVDSRGRERTDRLGTNGIPSTLG